MQALAGAYKQRMYFDFRLSQAHMGRDGALRAEQLASLLVSPALEAWATALDATTPPPQRWASWDFLLSDMVQRGEQVELVTALSFLRKLFL